MYDAFISYSRKDRNFVDKLRKHLSERDFNCWLDTEDLPAGEVWRDELKDAIIDSDNVLFIISPYSADSKYCGMEIEFSVQENKRIIPVLFEALKKNQRLHVGVSERQRVFFDQQNELESLELIISALREEQKWRKQHTNYLRRAENWSKNPDNEEFLYRTELEAAREWREKGATIDPGPTELHIQYINESHAYHIREDEKWKKNYTNALGRQLAAQAQLIVQHDAPALTERGLLLGVESMARFCEVGVRSLEADQAIRKGLSFMARPLLHCTSEEDINWQALALHSILPLVAFGDKKGRLFIWNLSEGTLKQVTGTREPVEQVAFSPDGTWLAAGDGAGQLLLLDHTAGDERPLSMPDITAPVRSICFSRDSQCLAVAFGKTALIWDIASQEEPVILSDENISQVIVSMTFNPSADVLITQSVMDSTLCWKWREQRVIARINSGGNHVTHTSDGRYLGISSARTYKALLWDVYKQEHHDIANNAAKLVFSEDDRFVAIASPEHFARIWLLPQLTIMHNLKHNTEVWDLAFSPDGNHLITKAKDNVVYVWDTSTGKQTARLIHNEHVHSARFLGDSRHVLTHSGANTLIVWSTQHLREVRLLKHQVAVLGVAFNPSDQRILATEARSSQYERSYLLIDWTTEQIVETIKIDGQEVKGFDYAKQLINNHRQQSGKKIESPDGALIAVADEDNVRITTDAKEEDIQCVLQHDKNITRMVFSPDSAYLMTVSDHDTARIWEIETGHEVARLTHDHPNLVDADFSPDGRYVATASWDLTARIWLWHPEDLLNEASSRLRRSLTEEEWNMYLPDEEAYNPNNWKKYLPQK